MNSDHLLWQATAARHLFVIGAGYIGCELAAIYRDLGSRVTVAEARPRLLPNWDSIAGEQFRNVLLKAGVEVLVNEPIELPPPISGSTPTYKLTNGAVIQPDITLVATGRRPNSGELGLESVGLTSGAWIPVNESMQTPVESIFAVGDVNGISLLDSVATAQANVAVDNIVGRPVRFDKRWFSQFLHTEPPIASIGWTEEDAEIAGLPVEVLSWSGSTFTDDDFTTIDRERMAINPNKSQNRIVTRIENVIGLRASLPIVCIAKSRGFEVIFPSSAIFREMGQIFGTLQRQSSCALSSLLASNTFLSVGFEN